MSSIRAIKLKTKKKNKIRKTTELYLGLYFSEEERDGGREEEIDWRQGGRAEKIC